MPVPAASEARKMQPGGVRTVERAIIDRWAELARGGQEASAGNVAVEIIDLTWHRGVLPPWADDLEREQFKAWCASHGIDAGGV